MANFAMSLRGRRVLRSNQGVLCSATLWSKYGHFWLKKNQDGDGSRLQKQWGDVTVGLHLKLTNSVNFTMYNNRDFDFRE